MHQRTQRTFIRDALAGQGLDSEITVAGWVRTVRLSKGGFAFVALNDGSCQETFQVVAGQALANYGSEIAKLAAGCSVVAQGKLVSSQGKGQSYELQASELRVLGWADPAKYPIQQKHHTYEFLRTQAHLRSRTNTFGAVARVRNAISMAIHEFFQSRGFLYIHTPIITASDCEGAGQMFRVTTLDPANPPRVDGQADGPVDFGQDFFGRRTNLTVSGQLEGETYACALGNVYTFGPTFRAENSNTTRHLAEFWMVEPEMAFCDLHGNADLAEEFVKFIFAAVLERCPGEMAFFNERVDKTILDTLTHIIQSPFERVPYTEAVAILEKSGQPFEYAVHWGIDLQSEHERYLTETHFRRPVIVTDYPSTIKPFYMRLSDDGRTVAAMDVLVPKIGEIIGGSQREERLDVLERRMQVQNLSPEDYW